MALVPVNRIERSTPLNSSTPIMMGTGVSILNKPCEHSSSPAATETKVSTRGNPNRA
ncbi:hypothetical protein FQZ97_1080260 [compost metagenome]